MAKGPKGERRPDDPAEAAVVAVQIALGEAHEELDSVPPKDAAAVSLGRRGGLVGGRMRANKLTADQKRQIAKKAADARWGSRAKGK